MGRKDFAAPSGGGGGGAPFASGMGGIDGPDPFRGIMGGGGGGAAAAPLEGSMGGGAGGGAAPLEGSMGGGGGGEGGGNLVGAAFDASSGGDCINIGCGDAGIRFSCSMGCGGAGGDDDAGIIGVPADATVFGVNMNGEGGAGTATIASAGLVNEVVEVVSIVVTGVLPSITPFLLTISRFLVLFKSDLGT